jgi:anti-anti-sigma factor
MALPPALGIASERTSDWSCVVSVSGELDRATVPSLREVLQEPLNDDRVSRVVVDLTDVDFLDGGGLGLLLEASDAMRARARRFCIVCTNKHILRLFTLVDARRRLAVVRSRETALANGHP